MGKEENTKVKSEEVNSTELNQDDALNVLVKAVRVAQSKGAYSIEDAEIISKAIKVFTTPDVVEENNNKL